MKLNYGIDKDIIIVAAEKVESGTKTFSTKSLENNNLSLGK